MYKERKAKIKYHDQAFLNPHAIFLRDLSVAFIQGFAKKNTKILDPTAATGIRGIRFYLETKSKSILCLDINKNAANMARKNAKFNKTKIKVINTSIQEFASSSKENFTVIDLDPFGSFAPYTHDIMKILKDGGYLLATATDTAVLCGAHEKACVKIYDAKPMHNEVCHEVGIRILLAHIAKVAAQFNYGVEPIMSLSYLHYMKVFVKVKHGAVASDASVKQLGYAYYCNKCGYRSIEKGMFPKKSKCELCGFRLEIAGRLWADKLHDKKQIKRMLNYLIKNKMDKSEVKILDTLYKELEDPLYYSIPRETKRLKIPSVKHSDVVNKLRKKGFKVSRTHFDSTSIKTDANIVDLQNAIKA